MTKALITKELVHRLDKVDFDYTRFRMESIRRIAGDGLGIEFFEDDGIYGLLSRAIPNPFFNRVLGRLSENQDRVRALAGRYLECRAPLSFEVSPGFINEKLASLLFDLGFAQTSFHPVLVGQASELADQQPSLPVEIVKGGDALEAFKAVYVDGWDVSPGFAPILRSYIDQWVTYPDWTLYLAKLGDEPAAVGVLHRSGGIGYLADAATSKALRGKGGQKAVLQARMRDAIASGCEFIMSRAEFDSTSQHNMERLGMRVAYTRAVWTRLTTLEAQ